MVAITGVLTIVFFVLLLLVVSIAALRKERFFKPKITALLITALSVGVVLSLSGFLVASHLKSESNADVYIALKACRDRDYELMQSRLATAVAKGGARYETNSVNAMALLAQQDLNGANEYIKQIEYGMGLSKQEQAVAQRIRVLSEDYVKRPENYQKEYDAIWSDLQGMLGLSVSTKTRCDKYYEIEKALGGLTGRVESSSLPDIGELIGEFQTKYPDNRDIHYLKIRYNLANSNYQYADKLAVKMIEDKDHLYNRALYADTLLQDIYLSSKVYQQSLDIKDDEIYKYNHEAEEKRLKAAELEDQYKAETSGKKKESLQKKMTALKLEADEAAQKARSVPCLRILNYLRAKRDLFGDTTGILGIQEAKIYFCMDDYEKAEAALDKLFADKNRLSYGSEVKVVLSDLSNLTARYQAAKQQNDRANLERMVHVLVEKGGSCVPLKEDSLNGKFAAFILNYLLSQKQPA